MSWTKEQKRAHRAAVGKAKPPPPPCALCLSPQAKRMSRLYGKGTARLCYGCRRCLEALARFPFQRAALLSVEVAVRAASILAGARSHPGTGPETISRRDITAGPDQTEQYQGRSANDASSQDLAWIDRQLANLDLPEAVRGRLVAARVAVVGTDDTVEAAPFYNVHGETLED